MADGDRSSTKRRKLTEDVSFSADGSVTATTNWAVTRTIRKPPLHQWKGCSGYKAEEALTLHTLTFLNMEDLTKYQRVSKQWKQLCKLAIQKKAPSPPRAFQSNNELREAITRSCTYDPEVMEELASTYGYPIDKWDVSGITYFAGLFKDIDNFNEYIGSWDVSKAKNMSKMFYNALSFNQSLDSWNLSSVEDISGMFAGARSFNQCLNSWNTSKITKMSCVFQGATCFNKALDSWDTSKVTINVMYV